MKLDAVIFATKLLQAVNIGGLNYKNCCQIVPSSPLAFGDLLTDEAGTEKEAVLIANAVALNNAIFRWSTELSIIELPHNAFSLPVITYSAICTLCPTGAWRSVQEFSPFLNNMIHCIHL